MIHRLSRCGALALPLLLATLAPGQEPGAEEPGSPFGSFSFTLDNRPAEEQVALLSSLGYDGMTIGAIGMGGGVELVRSYAEVPAVRAGDFRVYGILWWQNPLTVPLDTEWLDAILPLAAQMDAALWVVADGPKTDLPQLVPFLREVADHCRDRGVTLCLYPHQGAAFDDAEEAYALWEQLERPEVRLSVHLCHEIRAGNDGRLDAVIAKVAPLLSLASVNGADTARMRGGNWEDGCILPLDRGDFDVRPYLRSLRAHGYRGPILLQTYGQKDPPEEHLARSVAKWRELRAELDAE